MCNETGDLSESLSQFATWSRSVNTKRERMKWLCEGCPHVVTSHVGLVGSIEWSPFTDNVHRHSFSTRVMNRSQKTALFTLHPQLLPSSILAIDAGLPGNRRTGSPSDMRHFAPIWIRVTAKVQEPLVTLVERYVCPSWVVTRHRKVKWESNWLNPLIIQHLLLANSSCNGIF